AKCLLAWRAEGVLIADPEPSIYAYAQRFTLPCDPSHKEYERRGFIALGKLEDYENEIVHRHEQTLSGPKTDRLNLLRATQAHCGQIFMIYSDPDRQVDNLLFGGSGTAQQSGTAAAAPAPDADIMDEYGVRHRLWRVSESGIVRRVQEAMLNKKLIIADGHHRYETALNYRDERRAQAGGLNPEAPYERVMMTFVNMDSEGLVVLPTHRVVFGLERFDPAAFVEAARPFFAVNALRERVTTTSATSLLGQKAQSGTALIAVTERADFIIEQRDDCTAAERLLAGLSQRQHALDVVQLHKILLEHVLNISPEAIREQTNIRYVRGAEDAIHQVRSGKAQAAFLMNPVRLEQVSEIAFAGEVLPQKSTDFYPKLLSGLTIYALE
ncbi:MAG TPA: DUF1015 domain-containing protein, partial [Terriglobales bacterium]|nr:DUF1015 domain-containing protein [Terriglobales bacterium]